MARPTTYDEDLRRRLLDAAAQQVDRDGPERTSLREIARTAGTSTSAVYALFGGKEDLLAAVVADAFASFAAAQAEAAPGGLRALGEAYRAWALEHPALYRLMFSGVLAAYEHTTESPDEALAPLVAALAARGARARSGQPRVRLRRPARGGSGRGLCRGARRDRAPLVLSCYWP
jgi:AcrR family transcriptional regulator